MLSYALAVFLSTQVRWCTFSYSNVINLSFRLLGRSGGAIDSLGAWLGDGSSEAVPLPTPPPPPSLPSSTNDSGRNGTIPSAVAVARPRTATRAEAELANEKALRGLSVSVICRDSFR